MLRHSVSAPAGSSRLQTKPYGFGLPLYPLVLPLLRNVERVHLTAKYHSSWDVSSLAGPPSPNLVFRPEVGWSLGRTLSMRSYADAGSRSACIQTYAQGRSNPLTLRIVLSKNRFRFWKRCCSQPSRHDETAGEYRMSFYELATLETALGSAGKAAESVERWVREGNGRL